MWRCQLIGAEQTEVLELCTSLMHCIGILKYGLRPNGVLNK